MPVSGQTLTGSGALWGTPPIRIGVPIRTSLRYAALFLHAARTNKSRYSQVGTPQSVIGIKGCSPALYCPTAEGESDVAQGGKILAERLVLVFVQWATSKVSPRFR
jgi:hypothetical protein